MLAEVPLVFILVGLAAYAVLAGADFGAGFWTLLAGGGRARAGAIREHAHHAMGPVWEANHVWLIFVLVVCWTAYPVAFGSIASTLAVPLFIAAIGIILRGTAYALRRQLAGAREQRADRALVRALVDPDARSRSAPSSADRLRPGAGRQRRGRPRHELAEPDLDAGRRARRRDRRPTWRPSTSPPTPSGSASRELGARLPAARALARASSPARWPSPGWSSCARTTRPHLGRADERRRARRGGRVGGSPAWRRSCSSAAGATGRRA